MARKTIPERPVRPVQDSAQKRANISRLKKRIAELELFDPDSVTQRFDDPAYLQLETAIDSTLVAAFGYQTVEYNRYSQAAKLDTGSYIISTSWDGTRDRRADERDAKRYAAEGKVRSIALLSQAVNDVEEELEPDGSIVASEESEIQRNAKQKVFVVHGHDEISVQQLARFLEKVNIQAVVLREQPDQGMTIIEKFETYAAQVGFAVILLTPDDIAQASSNSNTPKPRARQNVIFELGYFAGRLGRGRTCLLRKGEIEIPSDLYGVIYSELDVVDGWKLKLARELRAANIDFDFEAILK